MSPLEKLKAASNRKELADLLGFKASALTSIVYKTSIEQKYTAFEIPKKSGGSRTIKAPNEKLKKLQTHLGHLLYQCLADIEGRRRTPQVSFGFRKSVSIADNAHRHKNRRYVFNIDLADFFPSFNFGRVRGFFLKDKSFALNEVVATTIAQIACDGAALPQGSPCSPVISELIAQILDLRLLRFARKYKVQYSRYADDITFSTNQKIFPSAIATQNPDNSGAWVPSAELLNKIRNSGFKINEAKTRMHCRGSRQMVTGLVVNQKVNVASEYYRRARAMCDMLFQTGQYYKDRPLNEKGDSVEKPIFTTNLSSLEGILSFVYSITETEEKRTVQIQREKPRAIRALYRRFLFYKYCVALTAPLIITEGKTDRIYLREAIKRRADFQPRLGHLDKDKFEFSVRFLRYDHNASEVMNMRGGTGDLRSVLVDYLQNIDATKSSRKAFKHAPMSSPVVLILDNDSGLQDVAGMIKKNFGITIDLKSTAPFYHLKDNLYVVKTPEENGGSCIEDLFPKVWREVKLNGKSFSPKSTIDPEKEYGKEIFCRGVVVPNADKIDFSGFDPLLQRVVAALDHHIAKGK